MAPKYAMSDSEDSSAELVAPSVPSDDALEKALRDTVARIFKSGKMEELTVKRVRLAVEKSLGLEEGFFKGDSDWKLKSDQIIKDEVETQDRALQAEEKAEEDEEEETPVPPAKRKPSTQVKKVQPAKRIKAEDSKPRKRRKTSTPPESEEEDVERESSVPPSDESEEEEVKKPTKAKKPAVKHKARPIPPKQSDGTAESAGETEEEEDPKPSEGVEDKAGSESEMSVVLDEAPEPRRKRQKSSEGTSQKGKKKSSAKGKDADLDPDQAEIKRLQGWLLKCGVRKMWWRELAPYETPKAKIKHLKEMLRDVGMEGRYSLDKAKKIREERELKADLELVQEGAKQWGAESANEDSDGKPRRRLNRGLKSLAFLSDDGEETD